MAELQKTYNGYTCVNQDKLTRAIFGTIGSNGAPDGTGVGEDASAGDILAAYDRLGGLILKGKARVKMGSFYDFEKKQPRKKADVKLVFKDLRGKKVELDEDAEVPIEVQAAEKIREDEEAEAVAESKKKADKKAAKAKGKGKGKKAAEAEEEEDAEEGEVEELVDEEVE